MDNNKHIMIQRYHLPRLKILLKLIIRSKFLSFTFYLGNPLRDHQEIRSNQL